MKMIKQAVTATSVACSLVYAGQICNDYLIPTSATEQFVFKGGGAFVKDKRTGLMWKRCHEGQTFNNNKTPNNAKDDRCDGVPTDYARQDALTLMNNIADYRMPNIKELASIAELQCTEPAINLLAFPNQPNNWVWSSTYRKETNNTGSSTLNALSVNFETGVVGFNGTNYSSLRLIKYRGLSSL